MANTEDAAVTNFRDYLRVKSVQPNPDYAGAVTFLRKMAKELELPIHVIECVPGKPVVVITWEGSQPELPSILLNSHIDVVPVFPEFWKCDPFAAIKDDKGDIYARGSQDMKCVAIQYIEAIRRLKNEGKKFARTMHMSLVPDEEIGGEDGMRAWLKTEHFLSLNVGLALDEGLANPTDAFTVYYGERCPWWIEITCPGDPGHGSRFIENTAAEKLRRVINSFLDYRGEQEKKLKSDPSLKLGDVTTVNLNIINGGVQPNVVPVEYKAVFDIRITPTQNLAEFEQTIANWCKEAGSDVEYKFRQKLEDQSMTSISNDDPWWNVFSTTLQNQGCKLEPEIFPAATDSRYLRQKGYPAYGFSPMNHTPILLHDHNEFLNENIFLRGIELYTHLLPALASVPPISNK